MRASFQWSCWAAAAAIGLTLGCRAELPADTGGATAKLDASDAAAEVADSTSGAETADTQVGSDVDGGSSALDTVTDAAVNDAADGLADLPPAEATGGGR